MIDTKHVGKTAQGDDILLVTLANNGMVARILSLGAILQSVEVPDREGQRRDVVLGFENPLDYVGSTTYFGQVVGRYANRIRGAHFTLEGVGHNLEANEGAN